MISAITALLATPAGATVALIFSLNSFLLANLFARLPALQEELGLGHGELGLALTGLSAGTMVAILTSGRLTARHGAAAVAWNGALGLCLVGPLPALAWDAASLGVALALLGVVNGVVAVAMNAEAAAVEARTGASLMASFHAMFSLGGIGGAAAGALAAAAGCAPRYHLVLVAAAAALAMVTRSGTMSSGPTADAGPAGPAVAKPKGPLVGLALICFATMLCEGTASDWSALHIARDLDGGPVIAALGYAAFAAGMTVGRLKGDVLRDRFGEVELVSGGALLAAAGLGLGLLLGHPLPAALGFGCLGLGLSCAVPIILRAAAAVPGVAPGVGIAAVAGVGMAGFLAGPPLIGLLAEQVGLAAALGTVPALALAVAVLAPEALGAAGAATASPRVARLIGGLRPAAALTRLWAGGTRVAGGLLAPTPVEPALR